MKENSELIRLHNILTERRNLYSKIGSGEIQAQNDLDSAIKVGRVRKKVIENISRLEEKIDINGVRERYIKVRELYNQGYLNEEEYAVHKKLADTVGVDEPKSLEEEFSSLGLKKINLRIVKILSESSLKNPVSSQKIADRINQECGTHYNKTHITSDFVRIRAKLEKGGYMIYSISTNRLGKHGYYLGPLPVDQSSLK